MNQRFSTRSSGYSAAFFSARFVVSSGEMISLAMPGCRAHGLELDWNKLSPGGKNVNALTSERLTDIGEAATFYSTLVEVARA